ncbi:uncharacterized protein LOC135933898 isoform X2 [Cloeon dipterum]|uniref:uncharacterized protein LOC135933898 isoform X2 n=1 Tax=Cloeon dipterum TaxID=197152 RepID=UPI00322031C2
MRLSQQLTIIFIFLCSLGLKAKAEELLIVRQRLQNATTELQCFYNGPQDKSVGLAWILPAGVRRANESHQRWKHKSSESFIRGHFEYYGTVWDSTNSMHVKNNILPPVLDERWNEFNEVQTAPNENFQLLSRFTTNRLHLSILAKNDAQIALQTGDSAHTSISYLITLDPSYQTPGSLNLELCPGGVSRERSSHRCSLLTKTDSRDSASLLKNGKEWTHFTISIEEEHSLAHRIKMIDATSGKILLDYRKQPAYHRLPSGISVRTLDSTGSWKIHAYRVVIHNAKEDGEGFNVNEVSKPTNSCLHIHYFFRAGFGKALVRTKDGSVTIELEPTNGKWRHAIIRAPMNPPSDYLHFIPPFGPHLHFVGTVFAINQPFRVCGEEEFFTSKIVLPEGTDPTNTVCQTISSDADEQYAAVHGTIFTEKNKNSDCPRNTFGKYCNITCGSVMSDKSCQSKVQCDKEICTCLPGYMPTNKWETTCSTVTAEQATIAPQLTESPFLAVEDEDISINKQSSEEYIDSEAEYTQESREQNRSYVIWWIVGITCSWLITMCALVLVFRERPDLVPVWMYSLMMRCTGRNAGGQLINDE